MRNDWIERESANANYQGVSQVDPGQSHVKHTAADQKMVGASQ